LPGFQARPGHPQHRDVNRYRCCDRANHSPLAIDVLRADCYGQRVSMPAWEPSAQHPSLYLFIRFNFTEEIAMSEAALNQEKEQLLDDVRQVLSSTEDLLGAAGDEGGEKGRELRRRLGENIKLAKTRLLEAEKVVVGKAKVAAKATDNYVHENPWKSIGIAAGVGFLLGMLVSRR
jgi:ElaB/YqjD/DUF883 family membrane-anchored ribosome-binding protein